jgi:gliding motility-associated-like protein
MKKSYLRIATLLFVMALSINKINAQLHCTTYPCFLCEWGGEFKVVAPNIFTPNGDAINDYWRPQVYNDACLSEYTLSIFNTWGDLIFESNTQSVGWNGKSVVGGNPCPEGTYYYVMGYANTFSKETKKLKGFFQLSR